MSCGKCKRCKKCCKEKFDLTVNCVAPSTTPSPAPAPGDPVALAWNPVVIPVVGQSMFPPVAPAQTTGQFVALADTVTGQASFTTTGPSLPSQNDFLGTSISLPVPSVPNTVSGFAVYFAQDTLIPWATLVISDLTYESTASARIFNTNIITITGGTPPPAAFYNAWVHVTHSAA